MKKTNKEAEAKLCNYCGPSKFCNYCGPAKK